MKRLNILVFPCGSEVGLEIHRSLKYSRHVRILGGNSVDDHGKFVFDEYFGDFPFIRDKTFLPFIKNFIKEHDIDGIYPAMDSVITLLKSHESELGCKIISSPKKTALLCASKISTYELFKEENFIPKLYISLNSIDTYPVFIKPDVGYGSIGSKKIDSYEEGLQHIGTLGKYVLTEYLPGEEFTVDCFTDMDNNLMFIGPRPRIRTKAGISVNTISLAKDKRKEFEVLAEIINAKLDFNGAWFFQVKRNTDGKLKLLEIASRMGGSSSLYRFKGVNFALLSVFVAFGQKVSIWENNCAIEIDRAFDVSMKFHFNFNNVYIDFDDCLIVNNLVNVTLVSKIYEYRNYGKKIILITRHEKNLKASLQKYRLDNLFDEVIHITDKTQKKSKFINCDKSIFIDDSYVERLDVAQTLNIPVFSPDMIN